MAKNKITSRFRLVSMGAVLLFALLGKVLFILHKATSSDVLVPGIIPTLLLRGFELCNIITVVCVITFTVYAHAYFGSRTCLSVSLVSLGGLFVAKLLMLVYNCIVNVLSTAQIISGALSYLVELLFDALLIIIGIIYSYTFAKKRCLSSQGTAERTFSPENCAIAVSGAYYTIQIIDLTLMFVIPYFREYGMPSSGDLLLMISDYAFYIACFGISVLLVYLSFRLTRKVTGNLVLKKYYKR